MARIPGTLEYKVGEYRFSIDDRSKLGQGSFASVFLGHEVATNRKVAIKIMECEENPRTVVNEMCVQMQLKSGSNPYIVENLFSTTGYHYEKTVIFLVQEHCNGKDFRKLLDQKGGLL